MEDKIFEAFLRRQYEEGMALARSSDLLELVPLDSLPVQRYIARFRAKGLVRSANGEIVEGNGCDIGISVPADYLRRADASEVFTYLGPHPQPWHPNIVPPLICVHIRPGTSLVDLLYTGFELWTWNLYYTGDEGLNHAASQWARNQRPSRFPVDKRPLKRRALHLRVEVTGKDRKQ